MKDIISKQNGVFMNNSNNLYIYFIVQFYAFGLRLNKVQYSLEKLIEGHITILII